MDLDKILARIRKMLAVAADSRGDVNETAAAAAQAERLMRKFNIDHADVIAAALKRDAASQMGTVRVKANMKRDDPSRPPLKRAPKWAGWLGFELALLHDSQVRFTWDDELGGVVVEFCGVQSDATVAGWMFDYLVGQMIAGVRHFTAQHRTRHGRPPDKAANEAFRHGFIHAMLASLQALRKMKATDLQDHNDGRALVVAKGLAVKEHFGDFTYGTAKARTVSDEAAFVRGLAAGAKVDVQRRAVANTQDTTLRIATQ